MLYTNGDKLVFGLVKHFDIVRFRESQQCLDFVCGSNIRENSIVNREFLQYMAFEKTVIFQPDNLLFNFDLVFYDQGSKQIGFIRIGHGNKKINPVHIQCLIRFGIFNIAMYHHDIDIFIQFVKLGDILIDHDHTVFIGERLGKRIAYGTGTCDHNIHIFTCL